MRADDKAVVLHILVEAAHMEHYIIGVECWQMGSDEILRDRKGQLVKSTSQLVLHVHGPSV